MKKGVSIRRDGNGVPHVVAENKADVYWGQGYVHAKDRGMQMLLMKILAQGRASELLDSGDETLEIDIFFRKMNWSGNIKGKLDELNKEEKRYLQLYCDGVNAAFSKQYPWELKLLGYRIETWTPEDCVVISRMTGYLTLVQSQAEMERLFVELVQAGVSGEKLEELFPGNLKGLDLDLVKGITLGERIVQPANLWNRAIPRMMASNNWVVSGRKTASGKPMVCNDPHLEINRLPNIWCEVVLKSENRFMTGGSMPGFPGVLTGRTSDTAWGVTYAFVDAVDSWVERCRDGKYYREEGDQWVEFRQRKEIIKRKKKDPVEVVFYENDHGVLDGDPAIEGDYLATLWAAADSGPATLSAVFKVWDTTTVDEGMEILRNIETGWSFVMADTLGDIGFQMSGCVPKRREGISGFIPLPGWKKENDWLGLIDPSHMPKVKNPDQGYFATANQNLNKYGTASPINVCMGTYRADRIGDLLEKKDNLTKNDMFEMLKDLHSTQAELYMDILKPLLPDTPQADILKKWDFNYHADSKGAFLFERFYKQLYRNVFGKNGFGEAAFDFLADETGIFIDFYDRFDTVLLSERSGWFGGKTRDELFKESAEEALDVTPKAWGDGREFMLTNILFGGKLPKFLGFDRGPLTGIGSRATIHQGQIYRSAGRDTTFMPSLRMVSDLADHDCHTNLPGGPSDRRFSKWYCSDLKNWINGNYKKVSPGAETNNPL